MTRYSKTSSGKYNIKGKLYEQLEGSRAQVYHGTAYKTSGGLKKDDIMMNKNKRIVSKSKHTSAKKENRLVKAGYGTKKGKFGFVKLGSKSTKSGKMSSSKKSRKSKKNTSRRSRKHRGGAGSTNSLSESIGSLSLSDDSGLSRSISSYSE